MAIPEAWQTPAVDDIDSDSLEYLFDPAKGRTADIPWVRMAREPEPVARISPEIIRLQGKMELLLGQLELISNQLKSAHVELGFAKAQLADRDAQLLQMAEYRARAAKAIVSDVERERLRARVCELEQQLADVLHGNIKPKTPAVSQPSYERRPTSATRTFDMPLMPFTYILMLCFATAVLATIYMPL